MALSGGLSFTSGTGDTIKAKISNDGTSVVLDLTQNAAEVQYTLTPAEALKLLQYLSILEQSIRFS